MEKPCPADAAHLCATAARCGTAARFGFCFDEEAPLNVGYMRRILPCCDMKTAALPVFALTGAKDGGRCRPPWRGLKIHALSLAGVPLEMGACFLSCPCGKYPPFIFFLPNGFPYATIKNTLKLKTTGEVHEICHCAFGKAF